MSDIKVKLFSFVCEQAALGKMNLSLDMQIEQDLGISGDDAVELIEDYSDEFSVDISDFEFSAYFEGEGNPILTSMINFLSGKKTKPKLPFSLGDMLDGIESGKLSGKG